MHWTLRISAAIALMLAGALAASAQSSVLGPDISPPTGPPPPSFLIEPEPPPRHLRAPGFSRACFDRHESPELEQNMAGIASRHCLCLDRRFARHGLRRDAYDFFARVYVEDVDDFIGEYTHGGDWLEILAEEETYCRSNPIPPLLGIHEASPAPFPRPAGSWGGIVRAGPGQRFERIGSLREGEDVTLLEDTGHVWQGYPWFRIAYRNGREGYKWGGILCARHDQADPSLSGECPKP